MTLVGEGSSVSVASDAVPASTYRRKIFARSRTTLSFFLTPLASVDAVGIYDRNFRLNLREFSASSLTCITSGAAAAAVAFATLANGNGHLVI